MGRKIKLKVYAIGGKTADKLNLQGDTEEVDIDDINTDEKWDRTRQSLLDAYGRRMDAIDLKMTWTDKDGHIRTDIPKGADQRGWRESIIDQLDLRRPAGIMEVDELNEKIDVRTRELLELVKESISKQALDTNVSTRDLAKPRRLLKELERYTK